MADQSTNPNIPSPFSPPAPSTGGAVTREEAVGVLFGDPRINILPSLWQINAILFPFTLGFQIGVAILDGGQGSILVLDMVPIALVLLYLISAILSYKAQVNNSPNLLIGSSVVTVMVCVWGLVALVCFGTVVIISGLNCTSENCAGVCVCSILLCFFTIIGLTVNLIGAQILSPLVCCNSQLRPGAQRPPTPSAAASGSTAADEVVFPPAPEIPDEEDDWRGIAQVTSIANDTFSYGLQVEQGVADGQDEAGNSCSSA